MQEKIMSALEWRYATKKFDAEKKITEEEVDTILESGRLAPSSLGTEPWKFIVVEEPELRAKMREVSWNQSQVTDASYIVVIARRTDVRENIVSELLARTAQTQGVEVSALAGLKQMAEGAIGMRDDVSLDAWVMAQTYIPLGMMISTASLLGIDSCPMEGFDAKAIDELLGLPAQHLHATTVLALGHRGDDSATTRPKVRRLKDDVIMYVK